MNYSYEDLKQITDVDKYNFEKYRNILDKRGNILDTNIFKIVSKKWHHENFHSDMLKFLFEKCPNFLELIGADKNNYLNHEIKREEGKIDILIKSDTHAIIIENKLNSAPDQDDQLYRYYKFVKEELKLEVEKIVYLTHSKADPSKNSLGYDINEKEDVNKNKYIKDIESKYINLVGFNGNENDLVFCLEKTLKTLTKKSEEDYRVFLKHYIDILKQTGVGDMSVIASKFLEDIKEQVKSDKDIIDKLKYTREMIDNLPMARMNYWKEKLVGSKIDGDGITGDNSCYKEYKSKDVTWIIEIYFHIDEDETKDSTVLLRNNYIWKDPKKDKKYQDMLMGILKEKNLLDNFSQSETDEDDLRLYLKKEFKPILEDDKALEMALKYDKILSSLDMPK